MSRFIERRRRKKTIIDLKIIYERQKNDVGFFIGIYFFSSEF